MIKILHSIAVLGVSCVLMSTVWADDPAGDTDYTIAVNSSPISGSLLGASVNYTSPRNFSTSSTSGSVPVQGTRDGNSGDSSIQFSGFDDNGEGPCIASHSEPDNPEACPSGYHVGTPLWPGPPKPPDMCYANGCWLFWCPVKNLNGHTVCDKHGPEAASATLQVTNTSITERGTFDSFKFDEKEATVTAMSRTHGAATKKGGIPAFNINDVSDKTLKFDTDPSSSH